MVEWWYCINAWSSGLFALIATLEQPRFGVDNNHFGEAILHCCVISPWSATRPLMPTLVEAGWRVRYGCMHAIRVVRVNGGW